MPNVIDIDSYYRDRNIYPNPCDFSITPGQVKEWVKTTRSKEYTADRTILHSVELDRLSMPYPRVELYADVIVSADSIVAGTGLVTFPSAHGLADEDIVECLDDVAPFVRGRQYYVDVIGLNTMTLSLAVPLTAILPASTMTFNPIRNKLRFAVVYSVPLNIDIRQTLVNGLSFLNIPKIYVDIDVDAGTFRNQDTIASIDGYHRNDKFVATLDVVQNDSDGAPVWLHYKTKTPQVMRFKMGEPLKIKLSDRSGDAITVFNDNPSSTTFPNPSKQILLSLNVTPFAQDSDYNSEANISKIALL